MTFDPTTIKDKATFVPENYNPSVTHYNDVNSHSNVQLSWDGEDKKRSNELVLGRAKKNDKGEIDYSHYLASSDSEEEEEDEEAVRAKYSALLKGMKSDDDEEEEEEEKGDEGEDADITFIPGLKDNFSKKMEEKAKEEAKKAEEASLSVYEAYRRKLKEKRKQKK